MIFLLLHIAIMAPPYVQGGGIGPNVYDKLNVASMGKVTTALIDLRIINCGYKQ